MWRQWGLTDSLDSNYITRRPGGAKSHHTFICRRRAPRHGRAPLSCFATVHLIINLHGAWCQEPLSAGIVLPTLGIPTK